MKFEEKTVKTISIYKGKIINVKKKEVLLSNGKRSYREIVEHRGAVAILPVLNNNRIVMVKQFRKPVEKILLEIPAGTLDKGEPPIRCARRELVEETGYKSSKIKKLCSFYPAPGYSTEIIHIYIATGLQQIGNSPEYDEFISPVIIPLNKAIEFVYSGKIKDAKTIVALLLYEKML